MLRTEKRENIQSFLSKMTSLKQPLIKNYKYDKGWRLNLTTWKRSMQRCVGGAVVSLHFQYLHKSKRNRLPLSFTRAWHFHSDQFPLASHCPSLSFHVQSIKKSSRLYFLCIRNLNISHHSHSSKYSQHPAWTPACIPPTLQQPLLHLYILF